MTQYLLNYICDPISKEKLNLVHPNFDPNGNVVSGILKSPSGNYYEIIRGIPRFLNNVPVETVTSFGDEWNKFNYTDFKINWLQHTVKNTFGSTDVFKDKIIVDAGGGSGSQTKWFAEYGAKHVIMLELSHSVDEVVQRNLAGLHNVDVIQCSIDAPPLKDGSIDGIVYCHNVIQHTPSVEKTAHALYSLLGPGGEFVFNCYSRNTKGILRWLRFQLNGGVRWILSKMPFKIIIGYAKTMALIRLIPGIGEILEKTSLCIQGDVPPIPGERISARLKRRFKAATLNTFDAFGSHSYQHYKTEQEIMKLVNSLQPEESKILNKDAYFSRPHPIGVAMRIFK